MEWWLTLGRRLGVVPLNGARGGTAPVRIEVLRVHGIVEKRGKACASSRASQVLRVEVGRTGYGQGSERGKTCADAREVRSEAWGVGS